MPSWNVALSVSMAIVTIFMQAHCFHRTTSCIVGNISVFFVPYDEADYRW